MELGVPVDAWFSVQGVTNPLQMCVGVHVDPCAGPPLNAWEHDTQEQRVSLVPRSSFRIQHSTERTGLPRKTSLQGRGQEPPRLIPFPLWCQGARKRSKNEGCVRRPGPSRALMPTRDRLSIMVTVVMGPTPRGTGSPRPC